MWVVVLFYLECRCFAYSGRSVQAERMCRCPGVQDERVCRCSHLHKPRRGFLKRNFKYKKLYRVNNTLNRWKLIPHYAKGDLCIPGPLHTGTFTYRDLCIPGPLHSGTFTYQNLFILGPLHTVTDLDYFKYMDFLYINSNLFFRLFNRIKSIIKWTHFFNYREQNWAI